MAHFGSPVERAGRVLSPYLSEEKPAERASDVGSERPARPRSGSLPSWSLVSVPCGAWHLVGAQYRAAMIALHLVASQVFKLNATSAF